MLVAEKSRTDYSSASQKVNRRCARSTCLRCWPSNYRKSLIFNLQPQNRITKTIQLLKAGKFDSLGDFEGDFLFFEN